MRLSPGCAAHKWRSRLPANFQESPALSRNGNAVKLRSPSTHLCTARLLPRGKGGRVTGLNQEIIIASRPERAVFFISPEWVLLDQNILE